MRQFYTIIMLFFLISGSAFAQSFSSETNEKRYKSFINNTRCMVCQNQNVAESNSMFSDNMKEWLFEAIESGQTDYEIKTALIDRFGDSVFYSPPFQANTILLWGLPGLFVIIGIFVIAWMRKCTSSLRGGTPTKQSILDNTGLLRLKPRNDGLLQEHPREDTKKSGESTS